MTGVTLIAVLLSLASISLAWTHRTITKLLMSLAIVFTHIAACVYYYNYTLSHISDSVAYYYDPFNYWNGPWGLGTTFVTQMTHIMKVDLGASYFDCFLIFQTFSLAGIAILARVFDEIEAKIGVAEQRAYWPLLFLPSLHFWTVAIGKDAPMLLALSLCVWSLLNFSKRFIYFCVALLLMVLFRAHIALMALLAIGAATLFGSSMSVTRKIGILILAFGGLLLVLGPVQQTLGANVTSASSVATFLSDQSDIGANYGGTTSIGDAAFPIRLLSLLFRPLFFDAIGILGIIASAENLLVLFAFFYMVTHPRDLLLLFRRVLFFRIMAIFTAALVLSLALIYFNVGLGLRERVMAYPMVYSMLVAMWSLRLKRTKLTPAAPPGLMVEPKTNRPVPELSGGR